MKKAMSFEQVLSSEFYWIVEALEHGCSDPNVIEHLKKELKAKTGYEWVE